MESRLSVYSVASLLALTAATGHAELSANIGLASDYMWRGASQTERDVAYSAGLDYAHDSGFFIGSWASNVEFGENGYEWDFYAGYAAEIDGLSYSVMFNHYAYPDYDDSDFTELLIDVSYSLLTVGLAYTVDSEFDSGEQFAEDDLYYYGALDFDLGQGLALTTTIGYYDFDNGDSYSHYQMDLSKSFDGCGDITLSYSKVEDDDAGYDETDYLTLAWSKSFEL
jgi:uncharacterized protein (TIGR02001 family)